MHSCTLLWGIILMVSGNPLLSCINLWNGMGDVFVCSLFLCGSNGARTSNIIHNIYIYVYIYIYFYRYNRIYNSHVQLIPPSSSHPYPSRLAASHLNRQSAEKLLGLEVSGGKKNVPWPQEGFVFFSDVKNSWNPTPKNLSSQTLKGQSGVYQFWISIEIVFFFFLLAKLYFINW